MIDGKSSLGRIFDANKFRIWLMIAVVLLSSFGFAFPPLAAIICMSVWNNTFVTQFMMYCLLDRVKREALVNVNKAYISQLESDVKESDIFFDRTVLLLCHISLGLFMSFFVFDMAGDTNGWIAGFITAIVLFITIAIASVSILYRKEITKMWLSLFIRNHESGGNNSEHNSEFEIKNPMNL